MTKTDNLNLGLLRLIKTELLLNQVGKTIIILEMKQESLQIEGYFLF
jgi:hypothetical protein